MHNITINIETQDSLKEHLDSKLSEFLAIWRHIKPVDTQEHDSYPDESSWSHYTIPIYTGYGLYCNAESLEDDKRDQYYKTYHQCLQDFCDILLTGGHAQDVLKDQCNVTFILLANSSPCEMATITITDDLIHINYITTGQW